ncbi:conserved hypothetical protein [Escherichia coli M605]|uniref:DUF826 domain-containing protein n=1 Tax=Escherichia coli M605 TaxID=656417 RepID=F4T747_ECOLX|nr:DUF826 domain-containing protein [Escherichia coli]EGI13124.1 conserved hypothetical protein [Escherichia coli M605]
MNIFYWLKSLIHKEQKTMPEIKDIVTDELVKNALKSEVVTLAVKTQIKNTLEPQIEVAVDNALSDILGVMSTGDTGE